MSSPAKELAARLSAGETPDDEAFDQLLPTLQRAHSRQYWTPVAVACRVAEWLVEQRCRRLLDIGSGAGKLCGIVALKTELSVVGLEHRADLIDCSRSLAESLGVAARATFIHAALGEVALPAVDAYFLYNPFGENLLGNDGQIDQSVDFSEARFRQDVRLVQGLLRRAPQGTCLITYNGFGGVIPPGYVDQRVERHGLNDLVLWRRDGPA
ncbi:MAG: methyltransferase [Polyangiaceae bacterium]|nr:methyltransferase [Myxococcales bacterium]MCB9585466.1 methyltransferase [Polyangiaceae bacterium]MCB9606518.1 methyltransferase [Polyangiaceae bacterium]